MTEQNTQEDVERLVMEAARLRKYIYDYGVSVNAKMDVIEEDLGKLEAENARLLAVKEGIAVERDACIGLILELASAKGYRAGMAQGHTVVVDLPAGQVSWSFGEEESHLFSWLPEYPEAVEEMPIEEKYRRVMNPGLRPE